MWVGVRERDSEIRQKDRELVKEGEKAEGEK